MAAGVGNKIEATDYNLIQSKIALVLGAGSSDYGYGQSVASSQVVEGNIISVTQWNNLRNDLVRARQHQTNITIGSDRPTNPGYIAGQDLTIPTVVDRILEVDRAAYNALADTITTSRLIIPPTGQASRENLIAPAIRTSPWNGTLSHSVTVSWTTANDARAYFNTGSQIWFSGSRTGGVGAGVPSSKNGTWSTLLTNMGIIKFGYTDTTTTGSGSASVIGYYDLTTSDQLIFQKSTELPTYSPNAYRIYARLGSPGGGVQIIFTIQFRDDSGGGTDEDVSGTLTSNVEVWRASGANVSVPVPPSTSSGI